MKGNEDFFFFKFCWNGCVEIKCFKYFLLSSKLINIKLVILCINKNDSGIISVVGYYVLIFEIYVFGSCFFVNVIKFICI